MASATDQPVAFRIGPFLAAAIAWPAVGGLAWAGVAAAVAAGREWIVGGLAGGGIVTLVAAAGVLIINPARPRPLTTWPFAWLAKSMLEPVVALGLGLLLYSATSLGAAAVLLPLVLAYWFALIGQTRRFVAATRALTDPTPAEGPPGGRPDPRPEGDADRLPDDPPTTAAGGPPRHDAPSAVSSENPKHAPSAR